MPYLMPHLMPRYIPADMAGKVIGKKGVIVTNIQRETGCKVVSALKAVNESLWSAVVIAGDPPNVFKAYKAVLDITHEVDDVIAEFPLSKHKHSFMLGAKGVNFIKKLSAGKLSSTFIYFYFF